SWATFDATRQEETSTAPGHQGRAHGRLVPVHTAILQLSVLQLTVVDVCRPVGTLARYASMVLARHSQQHKV
ncbi:hypothetical protein IW139_005413, partial [Coemansia sp. RSA 353]